ncbi:MAG TPA: hypothetical protein VH374_10050 [Polyangia bacterium]|nr:hypothetical protein [Polyangia bacterium]
MPGALLLAALCADACSGGSSASIPDGGDAGDPVGAFSVLLNEALDGTPAYVLIVGNVHSGPTPLAVQLTVSDTAGSCQLSKPVAYACGSGCGGTAVCVADGVCQNSPTLEDVGAVTVSGVAKAMGDKTVMLTSVNGNYSPTADEEPAYPPFSEGDDVEVDATGGKYAAFSIRAKAIAPLVLPADTVTVQRNQPVSLKWTAAGAAATSKIHVKLEISHHGGLKGQIDCDTTDTGALDISGSLVTELVDLGYSGYPSITVSRSAIGSTTIALGRVDLRVGEDIIRDVQIPGLVSCTADADCPTGQTCQTDLQCK